MQWPAFVLNFLSHLFLSAGCLIMLFGVIGTIILKDLFQRFHASTKCGVSGALLLLVGLSLQVRQLPFILKFIVILFFLLFTAPIIAHMLAISRLGDDAHEQEEDL